MAEEVPFFDTASLGRAEPKIRVYFKDGQFSFEWDHEDPELIAAGINDMTQDEWSAIVDKLTEEAQVYEQHLNTKPKGFK